MTTILSPFKFDLKKLKLITMNEDTFSYIWIENHERILIRKYEEYQADCKKQEYDISMTWNEFCNIMYQYVSFTVEENDN